MQACHTRTRTHQTTRPPTTDMGPHVARAHPRRRRRAACCRAPRPSLRTPHRRGHAQAPTRRHATTTCAPLSVNLRIKLRTSISARRRASAAFCASPRLRRRPTSPRSSLASTAGASPPSSPTRPTPARAAASRQRRSCCRRSRHAGACRHVRRPRHTCSWRPTTPRPRCTIPRHRPARDPPPAWRGRTARRASPRRRCAVGPGRRCSALQRCAVARSMPPYLDPYHPRRLYQGLSPPHRGCVLPYITSTRVRRRVDQGRARLRSEPLRVYTMCMFLYPSLACAPRRCCGVRRVARGVWRVLMVCGHPTWLGSHSRAGVSPTVPRACVERVGLRGLGGVWSSLQARLSSCLFACSLSFSVFVVGRVLSREVTGRDRVS